MDKRETFQLILDFWHRTIMHHAVWYGEVIHQYGREKVGRSCRWPMRKAGIFS